MMNYGFLKQEMNGVPYRELFNDYAQSNDVYEVVVTPCQGGSLTGGNVVANGVSLSVEMPVCV